MKNFKVVSRTDGRVHVSVVSYSEVAAETELKRLQKLGAVARVVPVAVGGDVPDSVLEEMRRAG
ncbi:hypothetical protein [Streptomyces lasiicapitis]|uniref:Uncharacterized protein n=1 Tax=Streptomyces lasiicapitis TaxID=1923961 RepID=A0ABQ2MVP7_9ACTN|nr:hypothetical protein [Streptomyces lasiicapitis]GGO58938.1 hypothetical protein GCM10012286_79390 [Streptomyces lasiicapitis]